MNTPKTKEEVLALLVALGSTAHEVADKLASLGIRGNKGACASCPIALYLAINDFNADVDPYTNAIHLEFDPEGRNHYRYSLTTYPELQGVKDFIRSFDKGQFPQCAR